MKRSNWTVSVDKNKMEMWFFYTFGPKSENRWFPKVFRYALKPQNDIIVAGAFIQRQYQTGTSAPNAEISDGKMINRLLLSHGWLSSENNWRVPDMSDTSEDYPISNSADYSIIR